MVPVTAKFDNERDLGLSMAKLVQWYKDRCDGDWEHSFGVKIDTLDNPGWVVKIDLKETPWQDLQARIGPQEIDELDWAIGEIKDGMYIGTGGIQNLSQVLEIFFRLVEPKDTAA